VNQTNVSRSPESYVLHGADCRPRRAPDPSSMLEILIDAIALHAHIRLCKAWTYIIARPHCEIHRDLPLLHTLNISCEHRLREPQTATMPFLLKYLALLAIGRSICCSHTPGHHSANTGRTATSTAVAVPQGNSQCAHYCQDNYEYCGYKNVGQCVSHAAHNGNQCQCCPEQSYFWCDNHGECCAQSDC